MGNTKLLFCSSKDDVTTLELFATNEDNVRFVIDDDYTTYAFIDLDKQTAIKLCKELKKQIALLD